MTAFNKNFSKRLNDGAEVKYNKSLDLQKIS